MSLLELSDIPLSLESARVLSVFGAGAPALWARLSGAVGSVAGPLLYKGGDASSWPPARRHAAGLLALFPAPQTPLGLTLPQLLRWSSRAEPLRELRRALRESAQALEIPVDILELPLDDARWRPLAARAEWLQAACLKPALVVSAAPTDALTCLLVGRLAVAGTAVLLTADGPAPPGAARLELP